MSLHQTPPGDHSPLPPKMPPATLSLEELLSTADRVFLDLDHLLVAPYGAHSALFVETVRSLGHPHAELAREIFVSLRGRSYQEILHGIFDGCGGEEALGCSQHGFKAALEKIASNICRGELSFAGQPRQEEGARELLEAVAHSGKEFLICTGSFRCIAELELKLSGLYEGLSPRQLLCSDDLPWDKSAARYWSHALNGVQPERTLGFEDRVYCARWMLKNGVGRVVLCPSNTEDDPSSLIEEFSDRVVVVSSLRMLSAAR